MKTRTKILNSAEELFAEQGFENVSIRSIVAKASVNIAAINYHFGNKEELTFAVVSRRIVELNNVRHDELVKMRKEYQGKPIPVKKLIHGFIYPAFRLSLVDQKNGSRFLQLMGRIMSNTYPNLKSRVILSFENIVQDYLVELQRSLPKMPPADVSQRFYFAIGSMAYVLMNQADSNDLQKKLQGEQSVHQVAEELINYCSGGFTITASSPKVNKTNVVIPHSSHLKQSNRRTHSKSI